MKNQPFPFNIFAAKGAIYNVATATVIIPNV